MTTSVALNNDQISAFAKEDVEYGSGDVVDPGVYVDVETGSVVQVQERDELPEGNRVVRYRRRFRRVTSDATRTGTLSLVRSR